MGEVSDIKKIKELINNIPDNSDDKIMIDLIGEIIKNNLGVEKYCVLLFTEKDEKLSESMISENFNLIEIIGLIELRKQEFILSNKKWGK